jgi:ligand-binding sensor domain-containing protein
MQQPKALLIPREGDTVLRRPRRVIALALLALGFNLVGQPRSGATQELSQPFSPPSAAGSAEDFASHADLSAGMRPLELSQAPEPTLLYLPWAGRLHRPEPVWIQYRSPRIEDLAYDEQNDLLWAASPNGLLRWDLRQGLESYQTFTARDGLASDELRTVAIDAAGQVWAGGVGGAARRDAGGSWTRWTAADGLPVEPGSSQTEVRALTEGPGGLMLAGTREGLAELGPDGRWATVPGFPLSASWVEDIAYHPASGEIAVATSKGAAIRSPDGSWERAGDHWVHATIFDKEGNLWFGGRGVSVRWRADGAWAWFDPAYTIRDLAFAADGSILCATDEGLSSRSSAGDWMHLVLPNGDLHERLVSLATAVDGRLWAGRWDGRLDQRDAAGHWSSRRVGGIPEEPKSLELGREGEVWIGGLGGAARLGADGDWRWYGWQEGLRVGGVVSIVVDQVGTAWIGSDGNDGREPFAALYTIDRAGRVVDRTPPDLDDRTPAPAILAQDGSVWHALDGSGLMVHRPDGSLERIALPQPFERSDIRRAAVDESGTLWWSLYGGDTVLGLDASGEWQILQVGNGLLAGDITDIDSQPWGSLWLVGERGIQQGYQRDSSHAVFQSAAELGFPLSRTGSLLGAVIGAGPNGEVAVAHNEGLGLMDWREWGDNWQHFERDQLPFRANVRELEIGPNGNIWLVSTTDGLSVLLR